MRYILGLTALLGLLAFSASGSAMDMGAHGGHGAPSAWTADDDADFLYGMIAHHKGALDMSEALRGKGKDPRVAEWAHAIIAAQQLEIAQMEAIAQKIGARDRGAGAQMASEMTAMMATPASPDADVNFVAQMIPHHAGAVEMSLPALVGSDNPEIRQLARDIIAAQAAEIYEFREWIIEHE